jgi:hypothetical protein
MTNQFKKTIEEEAFWVTNFSDRNVSLGDLYISIPAKSSVNLLDSRHYKFTKEQLEKSVTSGSIYKKRHLIAKRNVPPHMISKQLIETDPSVILPQRTKSGYEIRQERYEELEEFDDIDTLLEGNKISGVK